MAARRHKDIFSADIDWTAARSGVRFAQFLLDDGDPSSASMVLTEFGPGEVIEPHTHGCNYLEYIIEGSQKVGKVNFGAGDVRWVAAGTGYGPITTGPDGCTVLIVFQDAAKSAPVLLGSARARGA